MPHQVSTTSDAHPSHDVPACLQVYQPQVPLEQARPQQLHPPPRQLILEAAQQLLTHR